MSTEGHANLHTWSDDDKPRERLLKLGANALSNAELLAILLRTGSHAETVVDLSRRILQSVNNDIDELSKLNIATLQKKFKGIGTTKAITLAAALELGNRRKMKSAERERITTSTNIANYFIPLLNDLDHEEFWILSLNRSLHIVQAHCISKGGVSGTVVDTRLIMRHALDDLAAAVAICHNHPSGNLTASSQDIEITQKVKSACQFFDVQLIDHVIVGNGNFYSFADNNCL